MSRINTFYKQTTEQTQATFECDAIREWIEPYLSGKVLNACCGPSKLNHNTIVRNDRNPEVHADYHLDVAELPREFEPNTFSTIVFDPPWSIYQSNLRYDGHNVTKDSEGIDIDFSTLPQYADRKKNQLGHARVAKDGFDYLLEPGGVVIQLAYSGTCMPQRLGYNRIERAMFDPIGRAKTTIAAVDRKVQTKLNRQTITEVNPE